MYRIVQLTQGRTCADQSEIRYLKRDAAESVANRLNASTLSRMLGDSFYVTQTACNSKHLASFSDHESNEAAKSRSRNQ